jgi:hypothetical protein
MDRDYLIIFDEPRWEGSCHAFLETEEQLIQSIK